MPWLYKGTNMVAGLVLALALMSGALHAIPTALIPSRIGELGGDSLGGSCAFDSGSLDEAMVADSVTTLSIPVRKAPTVRKGLTMRQVIDKAKRKNKKAFNKRVNQLKSSKALVAIINDSNSKRLNLYIDLFAALSTDKQVSKLVKKTKGKHFVVSGTSDNPKVKIVKGNPKKKAIATGMPGSCPKGWVAWFAWVTGAEMLCVPIGIGLGVTTAGAGALIAGIACNFVMGWLQEAFIDFNNACIETLSKTYLRPRWHSNDSFAQRQGQLI